MENNIPADYGCVYEWRKDENSGFQYCLVLSAQAYSMNKLVSVLFLRPYTSEGTDVVPIQVNGRKWCVHIDLVTYTQRMYFVRKAGVASKETMKRVRTRLAAMLNLIDRREVSYEKLYHDLLEMVVNRKGDDYVGSISSEI